MNVSSSKNCDNIFFPNGTAVINFYSRNDRALIQEEFSPIRYKFNKVTLPFLHYLGLVTNIISAVVLLKRNMISNRRSLVYLVVLSFSDFLYNFMSELPNCLTMLRLTDKDIFKKSDLGCFFYDYRTTSFHFFSVLLTLFVTTDRFYHIYKPLVKLNRKYSSYRYRLFICFVIWLLAFLIALPHAFLMVYDSKQNDCNGRPLFLKPISNQTQLTIYQVYFTFVEPLVIWFIPGLMIMIMNAYVIYKIIKSNQDRQLNQLIKSKDDLKRRGTLVGRLSESVNDEVVVPLKNKRDTLCDEFIGLSPLNGGTNLTTTNGGESSRRSSAVIALRSSGLLALAERRSTIFLNGLKVNQISHYIMIMILGFYFILSTIPYAISISLLNLQSIRLNECLQTREDYLRDPEWIRYARLGELMAIFRILFTSNHCINFFFYMVFNSQFRRELIKSLSIYRKQRQPQS